MSGADISGVNYYGVVVNSAKVNVKQPKVHDIGESSLNGTQHGVGIFYTTVTQDGPRASVRISKNTVTGQGPVSYIAQNGIQFGGGATGHITGNTVTGNAYSGTNNASSCGILVWGGGSYPYTTGVSVSHNTLTNNDIGVYLNNADASGNPPRDQDTRFDHPQTRSPTARRRTSPGTPPGPAPTRSASASSATTTTSATTRSAARGTCTARATRPAGST